LHGVSIWAMRVVSGHIKDPLVPSQKLSNDPWQIIGAHLGVSLGRLETWFGAGGDTFARWITAAGAYADGLLILFQLDLGLGRLPWNAGPLAAVSKSGFKSQLLEYGFKSADVVAVDTAYGWSSAAPPRTRPAAPR
jgi:hypothetical protein